jgi:hypothetical protein
MSCQCCGQVDCGSCNGQTGGCQGSGCYSNSGVEQWCGGAIVRSLTQQCIRGTGFSQCAFLLSAAPQDVQNKYAGCYCMSAQSRCDIGSYQCCRVSWARGFSEYAVYVWLKDKCLWEKVYVELNLVKDSGCVRQGGACDCPPPPTCNPPSCPDTAPGRNDPANNITCQCNNPFP